MATPTYPDKPNTPSAQSGGKPSFQITGMKDAATSNTSDSDKALSKLGNIDYKKAAQANVPESQTSAGRLDKMLGSDSPLMKRAATQGKQMANNRGLLNSSMSAGAAQGAMIDRAQPFALQDSNNFFSQAQFNASQTNQMRGQWNQAMTQGALQDSGNAFNENQFNAQQQNAFGQQYNDLLGRAQLAEQQYGFQQANMQLDSNLQEKRMQLSQALEQGNMELANQLQQEINEQQYEFQSNLSDQQYQQSRGLNEQQYSNQRGLNEQGYGFEIGRIQQQLNNEIQRMGYAYELDQRNIPQNYAANISAQTLQNVQAIQADPNLEPDAKKAAIKNVIDMANANMSWAETFYNTPMPALRTPGAA